MLTSLSLSYTINAGKRSKRDDKKHQQEAPIPGAAPPSAMAYTCQDAQDRCVLAGKETPVQAGMQSAVSLDRPHMSVARFPVKSSLPSGPVSAGLPGRQNTIGAAAAGSATFCGPRHDALFCARAVCRVRCAHVVTAP